MDTYALANMSRFKEGDKIGGQYEVLSLLGTGGMSDVYRCDDLVLKRKVAVKVLHIDPVEAPRAIIRLQQEGQAIARLEHKNIIKPYGASVTLDGIPYLVMEIVDGQSLSTLLKAGPIGWSRTVRIIEQICDALAHAHEKGVIHRDLKPSNIMIENVGRPDEQVKLLDFGIAKITADTTIKATRAGEVFGTPAYMSPEQAEGKNVDARADQYAVGCLLYEMVSGSTPFSSDTALSVLMQHCQAKPPSIADMSSDKLPAHVESVFQRMLEKSPDKRFPNIKEAKEALLGSNTYTLGQNLRDWLFNRWVALILLIGIVSSIVPFLAGNMISPDKSAHQTVQSDNQVVNSMADLVNTGTDAGGDVEIGRQFATDKFVEKLNLKKMAFSANGIKTLAKFPRVKDLNLSKADGIDDQSLQYMTKLPLEKLDLAKTSITDQAMASVALLKDLVDLAINDTEVTDTGCQLLVRLHKLKTLNLNDLRITKKTLSVLGRLPITELKLDRNPRIKDDLAQLKSLQLTSLSVRADHLSDQNLQAIAGQKQLRYLNLEGNDALTDQGVLQATKQMIDLSTLNVKGTAVSAAAIASLQKRLPECVIEKGANLHKVNKPGSEDEEIINRF